MSLMHPDDFFPHYAIHEQLNTKNKHYTKSFIKIFDLFDEGLKTTENAEMAYIFVEFKLLSPKPKKLKIKIVNY